MKEGTDIALAHSGLSEEWWGLCDGMPLILAQRARQDGRWPDSVREEIWSEIRRTINPLRNIGWAYSDYREGQVEDPSVWTNNAERNILWLCATCGEGSEEWSGDLMVAEYEDLQESEAEEIHVNGCKIQEVFVKTLHQFPCANGTLKLLRRPRPSSTAEGR